jgi:hypothetical protein
MHDYFKSNKLKNIGANRAQYASGEGAKEYDERIND